MPPQDGACCAGRPLRPLRPRAKAAQPRRSPSRLGRGLGDRGGAHKVWLPQAARARGRRGGSRPVTPSLPASLPPSLTCPSPPRRWLRGRRAGGGRGPALLSRPSAPEGGGAAEAAPPRRPSRWSGAEQHVWALNFAALVTTQTNTQPSEDLSQPSPACSPAAASLIGGELIYLFDFPPFAPPRSFHTHTHPLPSLPPSPPSQPRSAPLRSAQPGRGAVGPAAAPARCPAAGRGTEGGRRARRGEAGAGEEGGGRQRGSGRPGGAPPGLALPAGWPRGRWGLFWGGGVMLLRGCVQGRVCGRAPPGWCARRPRQPQCTLCVCSAFAFCQGLCVTSGGAGLISPRTGC